MQTFEKYHQVITGEDDFRAGIGQFIHRRLWRENVGRRTYLGMAIDELKKLAERYFRFREQVLQPKKFLTAYFCAVKVSSSSIQCYFKFVISSGGESNLWCLCN